MNDAIKRVDAAEFAEHAAELLTAGEPLDIEQDGRVIGRYRPVPVPAATSQVESPPPNGRTANSQVTNGTAQKRPWPVDPQKHAAMEEIARLLQEIYDETGLTEDEFADLMDPSKPFPYDKVPER